MFMDSFPSPAASHACMFSQRWRRRIHKFGQGKNSTENLGGYTVAPLSEFMHAFGRTERRPSGAVTGEANVGFCG